MFLGFADIDGEVLNNRAMTWDDSTMVTGFSGLSAVVLNDVCRVDNGKADPSTKLPPTNLHPEYGIYER